MKKEHQNMAVALSLTSGAGMVAFSLSVFNVSSRVMFFMFCSDMICEERKDKETNNMAGTYEKTSSSVQEQFHSQVIPFPDTFSQKHHETENSFLFLFS